MNISIEEMPREIERLLEENEELQQRINKAIETIKDEGLVVAIKMINEENEEILLSSKDLLIGILKGSE